MVRAISAWARQAATLLMLLTGAGHACTVFAAGKGATRDASVLISHSDDGDASDDVRLIYVPPRNHSPGEKRPIFFSSGKFPRYVGSAMGPDYMPNEFTAGFNQTEPIGFIDQVELTFGYQTSTYGVINEHGLSMGESTTYAVFGTCGKGSSVGCEHGRSTGSALMSIDQLTYLALERCRTARGAVELMGDLAVRHGFYGAPDFEVGSGESLIVGDPDEAWVFHILSDPSGTSAIWAAQRLPDDHVTVVANMFTIREIDPDDKANYLHSANLFSVAENMGWWSPGRPLDFTRVYSRGEYDHKYYAGRRMWRGLQLAAPSLRLPEEYDDLRYAAAYPWSVKPDRLIDHRDVISWHRDWYAGTKYDMTKGVQAGPFGTPDRFDSKSEKVKGHWERSIALYRTDEVYVQQLRRAGAGESPLLASVSWYGAGPPHYTAFVPVPVGATRSIRVLREAVPQNVSLDSMSWVARKLLDVCQIRWDRMHPLVEAGQRAAEQQGEALLAGLRARGPSVGAEEVSSAVEAHAEAVLQDWRRLLLRTLFSFSGNNELSSFTDLSYPDDWLERSGWKEGPPDAPDEEQCPPACGPPRAPPSAAMEPRGRRRFRGSSGSEPGPPGPASAGGHGRPREGEEPVPLVV